MADDNRNGTPDESRTVYTVRLPTRIIEQAKNAAAHYRMSVTDFFQLCIATTYGQLEDRDGPIPERKRTTHIQLEDLSRELRQRAKTSKARRGQDGDH